MTLGCMCAGRVLGECRDTIAPDYKFLKYNDAFMYNPTLKQKALLSAHSSCLCEPYKQQFFT